MRRIWIVLLAVLMAVVVAAPAGAKKPNCDLDPSHPSCGSETVAEGMWCWERTENDAVWVEGQWDSDAGHYVIADFPGCIDIMPEHRELQSWNVEWVGETRKGTTKGVRLIFERGIHGEVYASTTEKVVAGSWITPYEISPSESNSPYVFVAISHAGERWLGPVSFTVTPLG